MLMGTTKPNLLRVSPVHTHAFMLDSRSPLLEGYSGPSPEATFSPHPSALEVYGPRREGMSDTEVTFPETSP